MPELPISGAVSGLEGLILRSSTSEGGANQRLLIMPGRQGHRIDQGPSAGVRRRRHWCAIQEARRGTEDTDRAMVDTVLRRPPGRRSFVFLLAV